MRYSVDFSSEWVETVMSEYSGKGCTVLDLFVGSGATRIEAESGGVAAYGFESHPCVQRIAETKLS
ncbi:DNA methyltransferase [Xylella taiwanensis]|nr:DNA methyltransferase [Xylella taiwanensis]